MLITRFILAADGATLAERSTLDTGLLDRGSLRAAQEILRQLRRWSGPVTVPSDGASPFVVELGFGHAGLAGFQAMDQAPHKTLNPMADMAGALRARGQNDEADRLEAILGDLRRHWPGRRPRRHGGRSGPFATAAYLATARSFTVSRGEQRTYHKVLPQEESQDEAGLWGLIGGVQLRRIRATEGMPEPLSDAWWRLIEETNREAEPVYRAILEARPAVVSNGRPVSGSGSFADCLAAAMLQGPGSARELKPPRRAGR